MLKSSLLNGILVLHITLCNTIRVPIDWTEESDVNYNEPIVKSNTNEEIVKKPERYPYFVYTAKKPQFAIDIAAAHDVKSPENHFRSYPVRPYTNVEKPELGKHFMLDEKKESFHPYQHYISANKDVSLVTPVSTSYDIYHPYKAEEPALQEIYKDPVLDKIRNDLRDSKNRLQQYENDAGHSDVTKDEYLESPKYTEYKYKPIKSQRSQFEIHKPLRLPLYYRPQTRNIFKEGIVFKRKLQHPLNQNYAKISPSHYQPIKNHLSFLKQQQATKFDDEHNEYPQLPIKESYTKIPDGYDIYEKGRNEFLKLRDNVDMHINKAVLENRPTSSEKLELNPNHDVNLAQDTSEKDEFIPIKNYAQVRKTETIKHLPRFAAFRDADTLDEIKNAPRLREAIKSTKAQVVYSEEGYEDSAYDHAGEQKHASDIEGHGGFLKEKELSGGKYKTPSVDASLNDVGGSTYVDQVVHGKKWDNDYRDSENETNTEDSSEKFLSEESSEKLLEHNNNNSDIKGEMPKKVFENDENDGSTIDVDHDHVLVKREFDNSKIIFNSSFSTGDQITMSKKVQEKKNNTEQDNKSKYPYYFKKSRMLNNDSPLRYAENLKFIPKKTLGGTEFYDSRKGIICPPIEEDVDPIPEKIKKGGNPDDDVNDEDSEFNQLKNKQRLGGLGDKIDCLKYKFFGENPLDSPFFKEDIIANPTPIMNSSISRTKRATPFMYEPYKIIKESQVMDSKKTTTANNISPLIKQIQSSRLVDRVTANQNKDQVVNRNTNKKYDKNIGKLDRQSQLKNESNDFQGKDFFDVSIDKRRGEPRYELRHRNHRNHYNPVKNITSISLDEYRDQSGFIDIPSHSHSMRPILNPKINLDKSKDLHSLEETQNGAASNFINKIILTTTLKPTSTMTLTDADDEHDEEYYVYDNDRKNKQGGKKNITTTSTTTYIPERRRKHISVPLKPTLDTEKANNDKPALQLKFRFKSPDIVPGIMKTNTYHPNAKINYSKLREKIPQNSREKKKNVSKSTIVTDTKSYGENDNDMGEKYIDSLIGVQNDADEYLPEYEKQKVLNNKKNNESPFIQPKDDDNDDMDENSEDIDSSEEDYEEDDDVEEFEDTEDSPEDDDKLSVKKRLKARELPEQTLPEITEEVTTTEITLQRDVIKPTVSKKRFEVHRELPVDKKSPNVSHFMQDIKEIEVIKTIPPMTRQKPRKILEALDLYKDENLAKDVNKLGGVEIFKENLDLTVGPKHGGNYRSIEEKNTSKDSSKKDVEASQSEYKNKSDLKDVGISLRRRSNIRNSKIELTDTTEIPIGHLHGGNLKQSPRRGTNKNEKIIELTDNNEGSLQLHGGNLRRGKSNDTNYRTENIKNSDIVEDPDEVNRELSEKKTKYDPDTNDKAAGILNSYVQAVPILTSPPPFIVDPSKRRYYYVDV